MQRVFRTAGVLIIIIVMAFTASLFLYSPPKPFVIPDGTKFIAHRGLSSQYFENSEDAFLGAAESPFFFAIETDIWLTADGKWLCAHENNPFRDRSKRISEITAAEAGILPLDTSISQYKTPGGDIFICTLEEYLDICKYFGKMPVIELKHVADAEEIANLSAAVSEVFDIGDVLFISFHAENINLFKKLEGARTMRMTWKASVADGIIASGESVGLNHRKLTSGLLKAAKKNGVEINVYTINNKKTAEQFMELGVDYITTDVIFQ